MKYVGIILAKKDSERLPGKNFLYIHDVVVWSYAEMAMNDLVKVYTFSHVHENRPEPAQVDEPIWQTLKWAYKSLPKRYDAIINIMANWLDMSKLHVCLKGNFPLLSLTRIPYRLG